MGWSRNQLMLLAILPKISSVLSLLGSGWVIIEVVTEGRKIENPYHRLILAMSVYDVLESVWNFGSSWPIPEGSPDVIWAVGNTATCTAQGFFLTLSVAVPIYNAMLSFYYVLVINYRYTNIMLRKRVEPIMHLIAFVWAFGTGLYSAFADLFNNANLWCWIAPLPWDCLDSLRHGTAEEGNPNPCIRGDNIYIYRFAFYFIPLWFSIFFATVCTLWVFRYVYHRDKETLEYRRPERPENSWWDHGDGDEDNPTTPNLSDSKKGHTGIRAKIEKALSFQKDAPVVKRGSASGSDVSSNKSMGKRIDSTGSGDEMFQEAVEEDFVARGDEKDNKNDIGYDENDNKNDVGHDENDQENDDEDDKDIREENKNQTTTRRQKISIRMKIEQWKGNRARYAEDMPRTYEVFRQARYYLGAFYCTHVWSTSNRIIQTITGGGTVFPLLAFHSFFDPFQGFLIFVVYQRPRYAQLRRRYPSIGRWETLIRSLRFSCMGDGPAWGNWRSSNSSNRAKRGSRTSSAFQSGQMRNPSSQDSNADGADD